MQFKEAIHIDSKLSAIATVPEAKAMTVSWILNKRMALYVLFWCNGFTKDLPLLDDLVNSS